ncbi:MAG: carbonic anhydrase [Myxococcota bacterium]
MPQRPESLSAAEAMQRLVDGNERYRRDRDEHPHNDAARRQELVSGQRPFASLLGCADSRVPPEIVFDQGLGDLFVIRVAGNILDAAVLGSLEFASLQLGVNLIVVMGHRSCGAVQAAVENADLDGPATNSHVDDLIAAIRPAVLAVTRPGSDDPLEDSVRAHARGVAAAIRTSAPVLGGLAGDVLQVRPAYYDLESGEVAWLCDEP